MFPTTPTMLLHQLTIICLLVSNTVFLLNLMHVYPQATLFTEPVMSWTLKTIFSLSLFILLPSCVLPLLSISISIIMLEILHFSSVKLRIAFEFPHVKACLQLTPFQAFFHGPFPLVAVNLHHHFYHTSLEILYTYQEIQVPRGSSRFTLSATYVVLGF